jgi:hypothetical protein
MAYGAARFAYWGWFPICPCQPAGRQDPAEISAGKIGRVKLDLDILMLFLVKAFDKVFPQKMTAEGFPHGSFRNQIKNGSIQILRDKACFSVIVFRLGMA